MSLPIHPEFTIETATPPPAKRGCHSISPLRVKLNALQPGQVLRWRSPSGSNAKVQNVVQAIKKAHADRAFAVRKEDGGFDVYRTA